MSSPEQEKPESCFVENRQWRRYKCNVDSCCYCAGQRWTCKITDLSERGIGINLKSPIKKGTIVNFTDPSIRAIVVWSSGDRAGFKIIN